MIREAVAESAQAFLLCEMLRVSAEQPVVDDDRRPGIVGCEFEVDEGVGNEAVGVVFVQSDEDVVGGVAGDGFVLAVDGGGEAEAGLFQREDGAGGGADQAFAGDAGMFGGGPGGRVHGEISGDAVRNEKAPRGECRRGLVGIRRVCRVRSGMPLQARRQASSD